MHKRKPFGIIAITYGPYIFGYIGLNILSLRSDNSSGINLSTFDIITLIAALSLLLVSSIYAWYWYISTARSMRAYAPIPNAILLFVPFANYWWMWRYSQAAESFTKGKLQATLAFVVLFLLGGIGMGIIQDYYNKTLDANGGQLPPVEPTTPPVA